MQPFKRTTEKVLAWIANTLLFIFTGVLGLAAFMGLGKQLAEDPDFIKGYLREAPPGHTAADAERTLDIAFKVGFVIFLVLAILALVATLTMKSRIVSGVLFLLTAIGVGLFSFLLFFLAYIPYLIVAIMLFVRKEPEQLPFNPYMTNGGYPYSTQNNQYSQGQDTFNQNVDGTNYQTTNTQNNNEEKVDKIEYL